MLNPFDTRDEIDILLSDVWYPTTIASAPKLGFGNCSPMFRDAQPAAGNVHDDSDDVEQRIRMIKARAIERCIDDLPTWQMRVATELHAANGAGASVWRNARMSPDEMAEAWQEARTLLESSFAERGLIEKVAMRAAVA